MAERDAKLVSEVTIEPSNTGSGHALVEENPAVDSEAQHDQEADKRLVKGGVIIRDGRSFIIGTGLTALAACINQIYFYKPVEVSFASVFLCLMAYVIGVTWSIVLPRRHHVEKYLPSQAKWLGPVVHFINPVTLASKNTPFHPFCQLQVEMERRLSKYLVRRDYAATAILTVCSASIFGYGLVGILRSIIVHPAPPTRTILMTIFGGISSNEGQGLFNFSLDWQYITSRYMSLPLLQQANSWVGIVLSYVMCFALYYGGAWGAKNYHFMSTAMFDAKTGGVYNQTAIFGKTAILDTQALKEHGLPRLTATNVWANMAAMAAMAAIGALISHISLFHGSLIKRSLKQAWKNEQPDPHYQVMQKNYKEVPLWWYIVVLLVGFFLGLGAVAKGQTTLDLWAYVVAILLGCIVAPFSLCLYGLLGTSVSTNNLSKMLCGVLQPGKPVANLSFSMFSHEITVLSVFLSTDLKMAQYLKIPWRVMFLLQTWGSLFGTALNYVIMDTITRNRRDILLDPLGNQVWSGQKIQSLNTTAVTWSLAKYIYGFGPDGYGWIPLSILIGAAIPILLWLVTRRYKTVGGWDLSKLVAPVIFHNASSTTAGTTSVVWSQIATGLWSQWYMRLRNPAWFGKYNYIVGGGLDAGAKVAMFILTFAVAGGSGKEVPFPTWWGNPVSNREQYADYCGTGIPVTK
ncbi:oligopeptide transporter 8 [Fusarium albosuccineum]|uniref:Oligopeptide transporter 8 n=1 Tax=Fusarium albosuccineum TaxID=1237068 RepID=A0A8H4LBA8_9HYPO|nr:oligopeptide transporter 8 [Fusarium albosuccineum]